MQGRCTNCRYSARTVRRLAAVALAKPQAPRLAARSRLRQVIGDLSQPVCRNGLCPLGSTSATADIGHARGQRLTVEGDVAADLLLLPLQSLLLRLEQDTDRIARSPSNRSPLDAAPDVPDRAMATIEQDGQLMPGIALILRLQVLVELSEGGLLRSAIVRRALVELREDVVLHC